MISRSGIKWLLVGGILILVALFFFLDLGQFFTLEQLKARQADFEGYFARNTGLTIAVYMAVYIAVTALSLPGATIMTLAGGALFGLWKGVIIISFASSIGATLAFLVSRFLLRDYVQNRFDDSLRAVNQGIEKEGAFYLFTLRLVPLFPFFIINLVMGLTPIRTAVYYIVSQIGMFPGTLVYVNAGTRLGAVESVKGILSPELIFSFVLLGVFPLFAKKTVAMFKGHKQLWKYPRPVRFNYNLVVIGGGSAGLVSAYIAAAVKAKVALVEKHQMGGDCLNTGCVPSKALLRSAHILSYIRRAREFGFREGEVDFDFADIMNRVMEIIERITPHDSVERYTRLGVDCIRGEARITSPYTVEVEDRRLTTRNIIIAAGARPFVPPIPGLEDIYFHTSDTIWEMRKLPGRLVVLGGGPIGCELAQAFAVLGSIVTLVEMQPKILSREDEEVSELMRQKFISEGIDILTDHRAKEVMVDENRKILICDFKGEEVLIPFDEILVAVGRAPNTDGYGLSELGVEIRPKGGTIRTDELLRTNFPNIYCAGDVAGPYQFTHAAAHQAWYASVNALFSPFKTFRADYRVIPRATFTSPEVACVGLNELEAREKGIDCEVTRFDIDDLDRAIADSENYGFIKVLTKPKTDRILGVTIVGRHAGEIISEYILAMKHHIGLNKILGTIHIYPTFAEANKYAAGEWKRRHTPEKLLNWIEKFHAWRRGGE